MEESMELTMETGSDPDMEGAMAAAGPSRELDNQELVEFIREYPDLDAKSIPSHVWKAVQDGESLSRAYGRHERQSLRQTNRQLQQQLSVLQHRADSRNRSLGSMHSAGGFGMADSFLAGFNEE